MAAGKKTVAMQAKIRLAGEVWCLCAATQGRIWHSSGRNEHEYILTHDEDAAVSLHFLVNPRVDGFAKRHDGLSAAGEALQRSGRALQRVKSGVIRIQCKEMDANYLCQP